MIFKLSLLNLSLLLFFFIFTKVMLSSYRKNNESFFLPDSKSQVSMLYENGIPKKVESSFLSGVLPTLTKLSIAVIGPKG